MKKVNFKVANMKNSSIGFIPPKKVKPKEEENTINEFDPFEPCIKFGENVRQTLKNSRTAQKNLYTYASYGSVYGEEKEIIAKFKVGDIVKIIADTSGSRNDIGEIGEIKRLNKKWTGNWQYLVNVPGNEYSMFENGSWSSEQDIESSEYIEIEPPTDEEILNSIQIECSEDSRVGCYMKILNRNNVLKKYSFGTEISRSLISCGVNEFSGFNNMFSFNKISNFFDSIGSKEHLLTKELHLKIIKDIFKKIFQSKRTGFLLMSTNIDNNESIDDITIVLDSFKNVSWYDTHNPNSHNNIRMWVCDLYKYQND